MNAKDQQNKRRDIPDWKLERFILNELDPGEMDEIRRMAESDESLRERLAAIEHSNKEILREYPSAWMGRRIREKLGMQDDAASVPMSRARSWFGWRILVPAGVIAVALTVFVFPILFPPGDETIRLKGPSLQLHAYRKTAAGSERLEDGATVAAEDLILLQYQTDDRPYGAIVSVDGWGTITRHLPVRGEHAVEMELNRARFLEHSYELDDAPSWEVFFFVTASSPFSIARVIRAIEESLSASRPDSASDAYVAPPELTLPEDFRVVKFTLIKESSHEN